MQRIAPLTKEVRDTIARGLHTDRMSSIEERAKGMAALNGLWMGLGGGGDSH